MEIKSISLADLDVNKQCESGFEFEVTDDATGKGTGIFLTVIGGHAEAVQAYTKKHVNEQRKITAMQEKRGKPVAARTIEEDIQFGSELAAIRVTGWRGISDAFTPEGAIQLCTINPPIKEQILKVSEDLANFTKSPATK